MKGDSVMWNNMGERLQKLAKVLCWVGIVCFTFLGLYRIADNGVNVLERIVRIAGGIVLSWVSSWSMYGLGIVVEYVEKKKQM